MITALEDPIHATEGWQRFLENPGPVVVSVPPRGWLLRRHLRVPVQALLPAQEGRAGRRVPLTCVVLAAVDARKQALHDKVAGTAVVRGRGLLLCGP
jgi:uncharacterized RDD family membrane protein YckC